MNFSSVIERSLRTILENHPIKKIIVAYSGGRDSSVLLDALAQLRPSIPPILIRVVHIHHGLQKAADDFADFCRSFCAHRGLPCHVIAVRVPLGGSVEEQARYARYAALAPFIEDSESYLFTAHHALDNIITAGMHWAQGAGLNGLLGMPLIKEFGRGFHARPLLQISSQILADYAQAHALTWIEDPSNQDQRWTRNAWRASIMPAIAQQYPAFEKTMLRTIEHLQESATLLADIAEEDWQHARLWNPYVGEGFSLSIIQTMSLPRVKNLLQYIFKKKQISAPPAVFLEECLRQIRTMSADKHGSWSWSMPPSLLEKSRKTRVYIESAYGVIYFLEEDFFVDLAQEALRQKLLLQKRQGGERYYCASLKKKRSLKRWIQEQKIPHFLREHLLCAVEAESQQVVAVFLKGQVLAHFVQGHDRAQEGGE